MMGFCRVFSVYCRSQIEGKQDRRKQTDYVLQGAKQERIRSCKRSLVLGMGLKI